MKNKLRDKVLEWNNAHPIDLWWRRKHNVAFMSKEHKSISFLQQAFEYHEDKMYEEVMKEEMKRRGLIEEEEDDRSEEEKINEMNEEFEEYLKEKGIDG